MHIELQCIGLGMLLEWEMECMTYLSAFQGLPCQSLWFSSLPYGLTRSFHVLLKFLLKHFAEMKSVQLIRAVPLLTECWLCWAKLFKHLFPEFEQAKHSCFLGRQKWWGKALLVPGGISVLETDCAVRWSQHSSSPESGRNTGQRVAYCFAKCSLSFLGATDQRCPFGTVVKYHFSRCLMQNSQSF